MFGQTLRSSGYTGNNPSQDVCRNVSDTFEYRSLFYSQQMNCRDYDNLLGHNLTNCIPKEFPRNLANGVRVRSTAYPDGRREGLS